MNFASILRAAPVGERINSHSGHGLPKTMRRLVKMARWKGNRPAVPVFENLEPRLLLSGVTPEDALAADLAAQAQAGIIKPIGEFHEEYDQVKNGSPLAGAQQIIGFSGELSDATAPLGDATPRGVSYMLYDNFGGSWADAEKQLGAGDDLMCWAGAVSNVLEWTGWGLTAGMTNTDQMFQYYQDHWTDNGGDMGFGWNWWFNGTNPGSGWSGWAQVDVAGGSFYPSESFSSYYHSSYSASSAMSVIDQYMHAGYGTTIGIFGPGGHAITVWGYNYDPANPSTYYGIWVTDSDDNKNTNNGDTAPNVLHYYDVAYSGGSWYLQNYYGSNAWYIGEVEALEVKPGSGHNIAPTLTTISALTGAGKDSPFTIAYDSLAAAANEADVDGNPISFRIESITSGTLTKSGSAITPGSTLLSAGESLVWTPASGATGILNAFTVRAYDGQLASASAVQVQVESLASNPRTFISADVPKAVSDLQTITSNLVISGVNNTIDDIDVVLNINHTNDSDLSVWLIAPDSTRVQLFTAVGGAGDNFTNTTLDDSASTDIGAGSSPFSGRFRPQGSLASLIGKNPNGTWQLEITDASANNTGTLTSWSLIILPHNDAPTLAAIANLTGAYQDSPYTITYNMLAAAADETDANGDTISFRVESVSGGALTKNGQAVSPGSTLLSPGESLLWTPGAGLTGLLNAFTVKAYDGQLASAAPVQVKVNVDPCIVKEFVSTNVPIAIPDVSLTYSTLNIANLAGRVIDVDVVLSLTHTYDADLDVWLMGPAGQTVELFTDVGGSGENFEGTLLDDEAATPITSGAAPFSGRFRPEGLLSAFDGLNPNGTWRLRILDDAAYDSGQLLYWAINFKMAETAPTLTAINTLAGATEDTPYTITYASLAAAANEADAEGDPIRFRIESVTSGTLTKNGVAVTPGSTLLAAGESLVWTPAANANGQLNAFTVKAWDGEMASASAVQVNVNVWSVNDAPVLAAIADQTMSHTQANLVVNLGATDADGDAITYTAAFASADNAYDVKTQLGLVAYLPQYDNYMGLGEKYFQPADGGNLYHIRPSGDIFRYMNGAYTVVAHVDPSYCTSPAALINAQPSTLPTPQQVGLSIVAGQLIIDPAADYTGRFAVTVTASDGVASTNRTFNVTVANAAPVLPAIANQTMSHNQDTLAVNLNATDADGDAITYTASFASADNAYTVKTQFGLSSYMPQWDNFSGLGEKYIAGANGINYQIRSDGRIYRNSDGYSQSVAQVAVQYYANPISLLNAQPADPPAPQQVSLSVVGGQVIIDPAANYTGQFTVNVTASDGIAAANRSFYVSVTNNAPALAIADQTMSHNQANLVLNLPAADADGDAITYAASFAPADNAYTVKTQFGLATYMPQWDNYSGLGEKYIAGANGINYQIRSDGRIYRNSDGYSQSVAQVAVQYYVNPLSLINAQPSNPPTPQQVSLTVVGNQIFIDPAANYTGQFIVNATASDGASTVSDSFNVSVTNNAPTLAIADQTMSHNQANLTLNLPATDADGDTITYTASFAPADNAYTVKTQFGLMTYLPQWNNYSGLGEKYIAGANGINYQIRSDGRIYRNSDGYSQSVAQVAVPYYANPLLLLSAQPADPPTPQQVSLTVAGNQIVIDPAASYTGQFTINVTASDGVSAVSDSFGVNVTNTAPALAIADQTMLHSQANLTLSLPAADADGDTITYTAAFAAADNAYTVKTQFGLSSYIPQWDNYSGLGEKYFSGANGINYQIRSDGRIYRNSDGYSQSVAQVAVQYYANPLLLLNAQPAYPPTPQQVNLTVVGNQIIIDPDVSYTGQFTINVTASDGVNTVNDSFSVNVTNTAPALVIADQSMLQSQDMLVLNLPAADADGDAITYTATIDQGGDAAYQVKQQLGLVAYLPQYDNYMGLGEKYFQPADGGNLYHIRANGNIYRYIGGAYTVVTNVNAMYYANPLALVNLQSSTPPAPEQVGLAVVGNQITINPSANYTGQFTVNVTASDGAATTGDSFTVEVVNLMGLSGNAATMSYTEGSGGRAVDPAMSIFNKLMVIDAVNAENDSQYTTYHQTLEGFGSRYYGSQANINARTYIYNQFVSMGLTTSIQGPYGNVVGELRGTDAPNTVYLIGAHFDSVPASPGGDDNASGTAGMLEAARILSQKQLGATVRFIAFNAEEKGLWGSANYVANKPPGETWAGMVSLDMILRPYDNLNPSAPLDLDLATKNSVACLDWANTFRNAAATYVKTLNVDPVTNIGSVWNYSDNAPFAANNVSPSFLAIENIGRGSNPLYHTPNDIHTAPSAMFNYAFAGDVTQTTIAAFAQSARIGSNTVLAGATVSITNYAAGQDFLGFTSQGGVTGSFDALTGTLSLTGSATAAVYQSVLQSVAYTNTSANPNTAARTVSFKVNDGTFDSNIFSRSIYVIAV